MGIAGLLPLLKKASKNCHVRKLSGCTVAIDGYCWLHKGAFGCAEKLGKGEPTDAYITYCMKYIQVLLDNKIKPILVLDGRNLPSKEHTEKKRREKRKENRELARKYLQQGKRKEAWECFTKCVDITPEMARAFIKVLRAKKIDYVVAPYEADAQLAYLAKTGIADVIITEDSDLVLFGCPKIFFKMNVNGDGVLFDQSKLPQCLGLTPSKFNFDRFRWMCIMSGCDYLPSIPGIGLGRAKKVILESNQDDIRELLLSIPSILVKVQVEVTEEYIDGFIQAENTFLYQLVFDTQKRILLPLNPYPVGVGPEDFPFAGSYETNKISVDLALGNIDLHTLKTVDHYEPLKSGYSATSIWSPSLESFKKKHFDFESKPPPSVGMQISNPVASSSKKKRPLTVVNSDQEDNVLDDKDLMSMYTKNPVKKEGRTKGLKKYTEDHISWSSDEEDLKPEIKSETDSPSSTTKRRRISVSQPKPVKENRILGDSSPSCNTRSRSQVPFLKKSPAFNSRVHVKSKYFRSEENEKKADVKQEVDDSSTASEDEFMTSSSSQNRASSPPPEISNLNLTIYSSQDSASSDTSVSQSSNLGLSNSEPIPTNRIKPCSVVIQKTEVITPEIILDDEENTDKTGSSTTSRYFSHSAPTPVLFDRVQPKTPAIHVAKSSCRRQGLSRSAKKDSKQPSVRDMFIKQKSVQ